MSEKAQNVQDVFLNHLRKNKTPVTTTVIHKFRAGLNKRRVADNSPEIFVLVDEMGVIVALTATRPNPISIEE